MEDPMGPDPTTDYITHLIHILLYLPTKLQMMLSPPPQSYHVSVVNIVSSSCFKKFFELLHCPQVCKSLLTFCLFDYTSIATIYTCFDIEKVGPEKAKNSNINKNVFIFFGETIYLNGCPNECIKDILGFAGELSPWRSWKPRLGAVCTSVQPLLTGPLRFLTFDFPLDFSSRLRCFLARSIDRVALLS